MLYELKNNLETYFLKDNLNMRNIYVFVLLRWLLELLAFFWVQDEDRYAFIYDS